MTPAARVVPDVPSFAVDKGFWYSIPPHLVSDLAVGSVVRVPLSGRRVRGWVVEIKDRDGANLKEIAAISADRPVFDAELLKALQWASIHYVAPLSGLITKASPPNLPKGSEGSLLRQGVDSGHILAELADRAATGRRSPITALLGNWRRLDWIGALAPILDAGRSAHVIAASVAEVELVSDAAKKVLGDVVAAVAGEDDAADTRAWERAQTAPVVLVGTPRTSAWRVAGLAMAVVLEESRRAMKDRQSPTVHTRDLVATRGRLEGFNPVFFGPTPGVELLSRGADLIRAENRAWPLVEVVDRSDDQPGSGFVSARSFQAISALAGDDRKVFVFTHRRAAAASMRCIRCRTLRSCPTCGTRLGRVSTCPQCSKAVRACANCGASEFEEMGTIPERLVAEINRREGREIASLAPSESRVTVGTERDLANLGLVDLAVAADVDGMLMGRGYRTAEEALRQLARLALAVRGTKGTRLILQTSRPDSLLVTTMRRGDPIPYLERVLVERAKDGYPPSVEMIAIEVRGEQPDGVEEDLAAVDADVTGPLTIDNGRRWLLTGSLRNARLQLRKVVGKWRDAGATVRIDVDPIDI